MIAYTAINNHIKNNNGLVKVLNVLDKAITYITIIFYIGYLLFCIIEIPHSGGNNLYRGVLVPAVSFIIVSIYRKIASKPRPYEVFDFKPILEKDTKGKSFPSRHVFSIFMVAFTIIQSNVYVGIFLALLGVVLSAIRVVGGVHFLKDVVAGFAIALIISILCYGILGGVFGLLMLPF